MLTFRVAKCSARITSRTQFFSLHSARSFDKNPPSFVVALNSGVGSSILKALVTAFERLHIVTSYAYDALGRLIKTAYPDLSFTQTVYDAAGRATQTIDALNNSTFYGYDDLAARRVQNRRHSL